MNQSKKVDARIRNLWILSGAFQKDPEKLAREYDNPDLAKEEAAYQIWSDGSICIQKSSKRGPQPPILVCNGKVSDSKLKFPHKTYSKYTFAFVTKEQAHEIRRAIGKKDYHDLVI